MGRTAADASPNILVYATSGFDNQLTWFDRAGKALGTVGGAGSHRTFALSRDGRRIVSARNPEKGIGIDADVWIGDVVRGEWSRLTFTPGQNSYPIWSPDGKSVAFRTGNPANLVRKDASGSQGEE